MAEIYCIAKFVDGVHEVAAAPVAFSDAFPLGRNFMSRNNLQSTHPILRCAIFNGHSELLVVQKLWICCIRLQQQQLLLQRHVPAGQRHLKLYILQMHTAAYPMWLPVETWNVKYVQFEVFVDCAVSMQSCVPAECISILWCGILMDIPRFDQIASDFSGP